MFGLTYKFSLMKLDVMERMQGSCLICFHSLKIKSDNDGYRELSTKDSTSIRYLEKLLSLTNFKSVIYDCFLICISCAKELDDAFHFRERAVKSLEYWRNVCQVKSESKENVIEESNCTTNDFRESTSEDLKNEIISESDNTEEIGGKAIKSLQYFKNNYQENSKCKENVIDENTHENSCTVSDLVGSTGECQKNENIKSENAEDKISSFSCGTCKNIFMTASELLHHSCLEFIIRTKERKEKKSNVINGKENHSFTCEICEKSFEKNWQLNRHVKVFHLNVKNYICNYCNRGFKQLYHLQEHITCHTGERNFKCNICNKTFSRMSSQRKHMKAHEAAPGEKSKKSPFLCSICGKKFPYSNGAQRHMRTHSDDRRYECNICGNKFSQTSHLRVHLRTHTGEKPYPCKLCAESFSLNANLRKHMKNHKKPENVKIFHNLEPNLSQTNGEFDFEDSKSDFIEREIPLSFVDGGF